jgi:hypothetical protein
VKTLVVLYGNARGGELCWQSMYKHLLQPYQADLALCFGKTEDHHSSLYSRAKFLWEIEEFSDWGEVLSMGAGNDNWKNLARRSKSTGILGGAVLDGEILAGSGAIVFSFRWLIKQQREVLETYDRIILTRSDHYYMSPHPVLENSHIWIVSGQDFGGICDRHHIFPCSEIDRVLGIVEYIEKMKQQESYSPKINPEWLLKQMFINNGAWRLVKRFKRVMFTAALPTDGTRWCKAERKFGDTGLLHKYYKEYEESKRNIQYMNLKISVVMITNGWSSRRNYAEETLKTLQNNGLFQNPFFSFILVNANPADSSHLDFLKSFEDPIQVTNTSKKLIDHDAMVFGLEQAAKVNCDIVLVMWDNITVCNHFPDKVIDFVMQHEDGLEIWDFSLYNTKHIARNLGENNFWDISSRNYKWSQCFALRRESAISYTKMANCSDHPSSKPNHKILFVRFCELRTIDKVRCTAPSIAYNIKLEKNIWLRIFQNIRKCPRTIISLIQQYLAKHRMST